MTKHVLIQRIHKETGIPRKDVKIVVEKFIEIIKDSIESKEKVSLKGFGIFKVKWRKNRTGRNFSTKEKISIPAQWKVVFEPSPKIKIKN
ncbi:MAG: HU family DNA-binding protein [Candidatus Hydrothermales bacterium]